MHKALTKRQIKFIDEYLTHRNATKAAINSGYSPNGAAQTAQNLLRNTYISGEIERRQALMSARAAVTADAVILEMAKIAFSNMDDFMQWDNDGTHVISSHELSREKKSCVSKIKVTKRKHYDHDGNVVDETTDTEIRLHDKQKALEGLCKHLGLFDNEESKESAKKKIKEFQMNYLRGKTIDHG